MKNTTLSSIIATTIALSSGLAHAQDAESKISPIQLNEQVREAAEASTHEEAKIRNTVRDQYRISEDKQVGDTEQKMEQHRYQYKQHNESNRSSHYGQGYESRTKSMGTFSQGDSRRQGGVRR